MRDPNEVIADFSVWGMIHAFTIRSPIAKGVLKEIIFPPLPDSFYAITADHIPGKNKLADFPVTVLADKNLSYIGQPIAILAGPDKAGLEELFLQTKIITEEETPLFSNVEENIIVRRDIERGEQVFPAGEKIVSGTYNTGIQEHWYAEPCGAVVVPSSFPAAGTGKKTEDAFTVYTATQWPFHVKRSIARLLGLDSENITVTPTLMTEHLDGKIWYPSLVACHAALTAFVSKQPVKLMLKRSEDFFFSPKRNAAKIEIQSGLGDKGKILGTKVSLELDLGAEEILSDEIIDQTCRGASGFYHHNTFKLNGVGFRTNIPPQGPMAGFGLSQGAFASERHISHIADTLGHDPAEWRKKNTPSLSELIDKAALMSDYYRKWASYELLRIQRGKEEWASSEPLRGIGIATACQGNGFLNNKEIKNRICTVELTLEKDGFLEIKTSLASSGVWYLHNWQKMAQEILGVDPALVKLTSNTKKTLDSGPGTLSRNIGIASKLVERCCMAIRKQRFRDPLPITVKRSDSTEAFAFDDPGWGAAVAEIEIDPVSFEPLVHGIWLAVDSGKLINEKRAVQMLKTATIHALGWTCREDLCYDNGKIPLEYHQCYDIPSPGEIPPIKVDFVKTDTAISKGIGDLPFSCVPAAYVQAVSQAMDHHFENIPLDICEIWDVWKLKQEEYSQ